MFPGIPGVSRKMPPPMVAAFVLTSHNHGLVLCPRLLPHVFPAQHHAGLRGSIVGRVAMSVPQEPQNCFLCNPPNDLVYARSEHAIALAGLGPLLPGYTVLGAVAHSGCAADLAEGPRQDLLSHAQRIRGTLSATFGRTLVTEHGRYPVCDFINNTSPHCYHAHFLMFPAAPDVPESDAAKHFERAESFAALADALNYARENTEYFLFSPEESRFVVFTKPREYVPQLARLLVASKLGIPLQANWRQFPRRAEACHTAANLRTVCGDEL